MADNRELTPDEALRLFAAASEAPRRVVGAHLDDEELLGLAEETLTDDQLTRAMRHVKSCLACAEAAERTMDALGAEDRPSAERTRAVWVPLEAAAASVGPVNRSRTRPSPTSWMGIAATVVLTITAGTYVGVEWRRAAAETALIRGTLAQRESRISDLETQLATARSRETAAERVISFSLRRSDPTRRTRDIGADGAQRLPMPDGAAFITLLVDLGPVLDSLDDRYDVVVTSPDRPQDWRSVVRPQERDGRYFVAATAPRSLLPNGDYAMIVNATGASGETREVAYTDFSLVAQRHSP